MPEFDPNVLARWTGGTWHGAPGGAITGFAIDSRRLSKGRLFVALRTAQRDGHDFLDAAAEAGAAGALVSSARPARLPQLVVSDPQTAFQTIAREHRRRFAGPVIGVTGSAGKTSTKELLALLLGPAAAATEGNLNNHLGVPLTLTGLDADRHKFAVVEAGISAPGEMKVLGEMIEPDVAVVTLVGPAHLEELGGIDGVAREKSELARHLRPGGAAIFPAACAEYAAFQDLPGRVLDLEFTRRPAGGGQEIGLRLGGRGPEQYYLPTASEGMAQNAAIALRVARYLGADAQAVRERLAAWRPAALRGEVRMDGGRLFYLDYYNANPVSMRDALKAFDRLAGRAAPRLFVIGCMEELGAQADAFHAELGGQLPLQPDDRVLLVGDFAAAVRRGAGSRSGQVTPIASAAEAAATVAEFAGPVFIKGSRKHKLEQALTVPAVPLPC